MGDLSKLAWSRDVTGKVDNIHSNLTPIASGILWKSFRNSSSLFMFLGWLLTLKCKIKKSCLDKFKDKFDNLDMEKYSSYLIMSLVELKLAKALNSSLPTEKKGSLAAQQFTQTQSSFE